MKACRNCLSIPVKTFNYISFSNINNFSVRSTSINFCNVIFLCSFLLHFLRHSILGRTPCMLVSFIDLTIYCSRCSCIHTHIYINNPHHTTILSQNKSTRNNKNQTRILVLIRVTFYWEIQLTLKIKI